MVIVNQKRLPLIAVVVCCLLLPLHLASQALVLDQRISLELIENTLPEAFAKIEKTGIVQFAYSRDFIPDIQITRQFRNQKLVRIMESLLRNTGLEYRLQEDHLIIFQQEEKNNSPKLVSRFSVSGYIRDADTGEELIGSTVQVIPPTVSGSTSFAGGGVSNDYGYFSVTLPRGNYQLRCGYLGYENAEVDIDLDENRRIDVELKPATHQLQEVIVHSNLEENRVTSNELGTHLLGVNFIKEAPALFGEQDVLQTIQLLPGVNAAGDGSGAFSVRGGSSDQNLILLDEAPIYHPAHLLGIFSVFNSDALKSIKLIKGAIPTPYRGRLSSVLDIRMKEGDIHKFGGTGGIGLITSRLKLEGQLVRDKSSFMVAARRTYLDFLIKLFSGSLDNRAGLFFSDVNAKMNFRLSPNDRIYLAGYFGRDVFRVDNQNEIGWGNTTTTLRWNHLFNDQLFLNTTFIFSDFGFNSLTNIQDALEDEGLENLNVRTEIKDFSLKQDFQLYADPKNTFKFGWGATHHQFVPAAVMEENETFQKEETQNAIELNTYFAQYRQFGDALQMEYGVHASNFSALGTDDYIYQFDSAGRRMDSIYYRRGQIIRNYFGLEPRVNLTYLWKESQAIKFSYARTYQYLQRLTSAFVNNPASVWLPSSNNIKPQLADQFSLGYFRSFGNKMEASVEVFWKNMHRQIDYRDGAVLGLAPRDIESLLVFGKSRAMGAEFFLRRKEGQLRGWLSYTFSSARSRFNSISNGNSFPSNFDRPHNLSVIAIWDISKKVLVAAKWVTYSGKPVTLPEGKYNIDGLIVDYYQRRNTYRLKPHRRLDVSLTLFRKGDRKRGTWNFAVYNLLGYRNPTFVYIDNTDDSHSTVNQVTLVTMVPSIMYNFKF